MKASPLVLLALALAGCGGARTTGGGASLMMSERLIACETLVSELRMLDTQSETEAELEAMRQTAVDNAEICARLWRESAESNGERLIAEQEARQLPFHALLLEAALSARFDDRFGYCDIIDDTFAILFEGLTELEGALESGSLSDDERARVIELHDLDLEAMDVLLLHRQENCD